MGTQLNANYLLGCIDDLDYSLLWQKVAQLKQTDAEGWAIGEMVSRALQWLEDHERPSPIEETEIMSH